MEPGSKGEALGKGRKHQISSRSKATASTLNLPKKPSISRDPTVEARKLEHHSSHALKVKYKGS